MGKEGVIRWKRLNVRNDSGDRNSNGNANGKGDEGKYVPLVAIVFPNPKVFIDLLQKPLESLSTGESCSQHTSACFPHLALLTILSLIQLTTYYFTAPI